MGVVLLPRNDDPESCATGDKSSARLAMPAALIPARPNGYPANSGERANGPVRAAAGAGPDLDWLPREPEKLAYFQRLGISLTSLPHRVHAGPLSVPPAATSLATSPSPVAEPRGPSSMPIRVVGTVSNPSGSAPG